jgi:hypothetical protein
VLDEPLLPHFRERGERFSNRTGLRGAEPTDAKVDDVQNIQPEVLDVLVDRLAQLIGRKRLGPPALGVAAGTYLGHDPQILRVGMKRFPDDLVDDVRAVVVARVDMGDPEGNDLAQDSNCLVAVGGRTKDVGSGKLHRAIADPGDREFLGEKKHASRVVP